MLFLVVGKIMNTMLDRKPAPSGRFTSSSLTSGPASGNRHPWMLASPRATARNTSAEKKACTKSSAVIRNRERSLNVASRSSRVPV